MDAELVAVSEVDLPEGMEPAWRVTDVDSLEFAMRRAAEHRRKQEEDEALYKSRLARLKQWRDVEREKDERAALFFESHIRAYVEQNRSALFVGKAKSRRFPFGRVGLKTKPARLKVVDADALLKWAREQPVEWELVRLKEEPAVSEIQRLFFSRTSGEHNVPAGMALESESETLVAEYEGVES